MTPSVIIIPVLNNPDQSEAAIKSACRQTGVDPLHVLVIDQGSDLATRERLETGWNLCPFLLWQHNPKLPSLAATWNRALDFAWEIGARDALVINNDVEMVPTYYRWLRERLEQDKLWFLSGVGVTPEQFKQFERTLAEGATWLPDQPFALHPDFSAYLITRTCHEKYRFDEAMFPAYLEDCDLHRRMLLGDDGRRIGKINLPFLHHASGTLKAADQAARDRIGRQIDQGSRAHYARKWGGPLNQERAVTPGGSPQEFDVTNDRLRAIAIDGGSVQEYCYGEAVRLAARS